ncbi:hypothetical protein GCM10009543_35080 [Leifsonia naganoensis]
MIASVSVSRRASTTIPEPLSETAGASPQVSVTITGTPAAIASSTLIG